MPHILINHLRWVHPDREILFENVSLSVEKGQKCSLIGDNGSGKSTLLRILAGEPHAPSGEVALAAPPYYVAQDTSRWDALTVADALGAGEKLRALRAILAGDVSEENYTRLGDDWGLEERIAAALAAWGLEWLGPDHPFGTLSGGEKTRVLLSGATLHEPEIILMDEPSNHLDSGAREQLYDFVRSSRAAMLIVSHDRALLDLCEVTGLLTPQGIALYGGNYSFYKEVHERQTQALRETLHEERKSLREARQTAREAAERKQRADARGARKQASEGQSRIMMRTMKDGAEASASRLKDTHAKKAEEISSRIGALRDKLPPANELRVKFAPPAIRPGRRLAELREVNYDYGTGELWPEPLSLKITAGERIALTGANGSGKSTLVRILTGELQPTAGEIERAPFTSLYVDQHYSLIDPRLTVYEQAARNNPNNLPESAIRTELHRFLLPAATWDQPCATLSGGERMKLLFCSMLIAQAAPDMLILDEPTNNLDIRSLEILSSAVRGYEGTLLVISHDSRFVEEATVERTILLERDNS